MATRTETGIAISIAIPTISALPMSASAIPPFSPKSGRASVKNVRSSWLKPL